MIKSTYEYKRLQFIEQIIEHTRIVQQLFIEQDVLDS